MSLAALFPSGTRGGGDLSPPLAWDAPPKGARGFAVFCLDPDAPLVSPEGHYGFVHWLLYNLPASARSLDEATTDGTLGVNYFDKVGYGGPLPPPELYLNLVYSRFSVTLLLIRLNTFTILE